jgi:hypothetical protein
MRTTAITGPPERRSPLENREIGGSACIALFVKELSDVVKVEMDSTLQCSASF